MATETITREEFGRRLDAANARRAEEQRVIEEQQARLASLLDALERRLDEFEKRLDAEEERTEDEPQTTQSSPPATQILDGERQTIRRVIQEYYDFLPEYEDVRAQAIMDDERGHYILFHTGWDGKRRVHGSVIHIEVRPDGKIWVHHDGTKYGVVDQLLEAGIPQDRIVLGWIHPYERQFTDFAVK